MSKYKIGDKVKITHKVDCDGWMPSMDITVGEQGIIARISTFSCQTARWYFIEGIHNTLLYPEGSLSKLQQQLEFSFME